MGLTIPFNFSFYEGSSTLSDAPYYLPVALGGKQYTIDLRKYERQTISQIRPPSDNSSEPGEQSLTQEGLWKRSQSSFRMGSGQEFFDEEDSIRQRFYTSKGVDPWTHRTLKLLKDTASKRASANTNLKVLQVGTRLYIADGNSVVYTNDPSVTVPTFNVTGIPTTQPVSSLTTDGVLVWAAMGTNGIYETTAGTGAATQRSATPHTLVGYANGRLICANADVIRECSRSGVLTQIMDHPNPSFVWNTICPAPNAIYIAGTCGDRSEIYATTALDATGALAPPILATTLPDGETLQAMTYYGGAILLGTSRGFRVAAIGSNNSLQYGPVVEIPNGGVNEFEGEGEYVWFTWNRYDGVSSGLGRIDLSRFTREMVPAYASDLMAAAQNNVLSVATVGGKRYFAVSQVGFFGEVNEYVQQGVFNSGRIMYGTTEKKIATALDLRHKPLPGGSSIAASITTEEGATAPIGSSGQKGSLSPVSSLSIEVEKTESISVGITLNRTATRSVGSGATTSGSRTVTSVSGAFTEADKGKDISGAGIPAGTYIEIINSATSVQISVPATATATGLTLTVGDATKTPELRRWTLYSRVTPVLSDEIIVPLVIHDWVQSQLGEGDSVYYNPLEEFQYLQALADGKSIVRYQEGGAAYNCYVTMVKVEPADWNADRSFFNGIIYVRLVTIDVV